jgi:hypothetical protein
MYNGKFRTSVAGGGKYSFILYGCACARKNYFAPSAQCAVAHGRIVLFITVKVLNIFGH